MKVALDFRFGHGMIPERLYKKIYAVCSSWWSDEPFPSGADMFDAPPKPCADLLEDPVRPCMSVAGDTYDMGGMCQRVCVQACSVCCLLLWQGGISFMIHAVAGACRGWKMFPL